MYSLFVFNKKGNDYKQWIQESKVKKTNFHEFPKMINEDKRNFIDKRWIRLWDIIHSDQVEKQKLEHWIRRGWFLHKNWLDHISVWRVMEIGYLTLMWNTRDNDQQNTTMPCVLLWPKVLFPWMCSTL